MVIIIVRTTIIYIFVLLILRLMGKRQLGELQASELVTTMIISNLASISIEQQSIPLLVSMLPVLIIACYEIFISAFTIKSAKFERFVEGEPRVIMSNGHFVQATLKLLRFTATEILGALRDKNIFDPNTVNVALIEPNGKLSVYAVERAPSHIDEKPPAAVIVDGMVVEDALKLADKDLGWLDEYLIQNGLTAKDILILMVYHNGTAYHEKYERGKR